MQEDIFLENPSYMMAYRSLKVNVSFSELWTESFSNTFSLMLLLIKILPLQSTGASVLRADEEVDQARKRQEKRHRSDETKENKSIWWAHFKTNAIQGYPEVLSFPILGGKRIGFYTVCFIVNVFYVQCFVFLIEQQSVSSLRNFEYVNNSM